MDVLPAIISGTAFGGGEIGNILEQRKKMQYQNYVNDLMMHPEKLAALAAKLQKPLDNSLVQGVTNTVQGNMAERGLSQAPGIFAATESQALAPYVQQNENTALQTVMQMLGMPAGSFGSPQNNSGSLQLFLNALKNRGGGGDPFGGGINIGPPIAPPDTTASADPNPWSIPS